MHTLITKAKPLCLHTILAYVVEQTVPKKESKPTHHQINFKSTVEKVVSGIKTHFPSTFRSCEDGSFLAKSKTFVDSMISSGNIEHVLDCVPSECETCGVKLEDWQRKIPRSYLITLGTIKKIKIPVKGVPVASVLSIPTCLRKDLYPCTTS